MMAKNRNKKKNKSGSAAMDMDVASPSPRASMGDASEAMDTSENFSSGVKVGGLLRKTTKGRPMKRSKNMRRTKATVKAISQNEKIEEKVSKSESKTLRTKSAKNLYD